MTVFPTGVCPQADGPPGPPLNDSEIVNVSESSKSDTTTPESEPEPEPEPADDEKKGEEDPLAMPPNLEEFIPEECLPDIINVFIDKDFLIEASSSYYGSSRYGGVEKASTAQLERPIKFVRQYARRRDVDKVINGPDRDCQCPKAKAPKKLITGQLDLRRFYTLGRGNHSKVFLAPLSITSKPTVHGAVAVKFSDPDSGAREMIRHEAKIYNSFPHDLQTGDVPVVPKFYGCYTPYIKATTNGLEEEEDSWTRETIPNCLAVPILLLEACGKAVCASSLDFPEKKSIELLLERLHEAKFVQGSMYERNILYQPGPLSVPPANRSGKEFRIIDFGRGNSIHTSDLETLKEGIEREKRYACRGGLIPFHY